MRASAHEIDTMRIIRLLQAPSRASGVERRLHSRQRRRVFRAIARIHVHPPFREFAPLFHRARRPERSRRVGVRPRSRLERVRALARRASASIVIAARNQPPSDRAAFRARRAAAHRADRLRARAHRSSAHRVRAPRARSSAFARAP